MNEQKAITTMRIFKNKYDKKATSRTPLKTVRYAFALAIQALEKQIAKKPVYSDFDDNGFDEIIPYKAECPVCGYEFEFGKWNDEENHHCICGQKMDWSDEE